jgi:hypothetical protein
MDISIQMARERVLEQEYSEMAIKTMENGILINKMGASKLYMQMVVLIGVNSKMEKAMVMELGRAQTVTSTLVSTRIITCTGMEFTHGEQEIYITDTGSKETETAKDIIDGQTVENITVNSKTT